jgi:hypothetical protein
MEIHMPYIVVAIVMMLGINFSSALAVEERSEFELAESGRVITFNSSVTAVGGLDPPRSNIGPEDDHAKAVDRFEMVESGVVIDFNPATESTPRFVLPGDAPSDRGRTEGVVPGPPVFEAHEIPESGHLIVFPRQVEKREAQALQMQPLGHVVTNRR